eukprot:m.168249 g.168249  ORF g.168249 m.168249 type:complete len:1116 (+) comp12932_c0_seq1:290-3637(+)
MRHTRTMAGGARLTAGAWLLAAALLPMEAASQTNRLDVYSLYELHECQGESTPVLNDPGRNVSNSEYFDHHEIDAIEMESNLWMYNEDPFGSHHWAFARGPLSWGVVLLAAIVVRMLWREIPFVGEKTPESVVEIVVGFIAGIVLDYGYGDPDYLGFDSGQFFFYILPWIILEAGYSINNYYVVQHLWTILLHAIVGTLFNVLLIGTVMWSVSEGVGVHNFGLDDGLLFGSFIAAVDPVAVLSVLTEFHVHPSVNAIVGGESLLNDGVAVVVYRIMVAVAYSESYLSEPVSPETYGEVVGLALLQMLIVFVGGAIVGTCTGILSCYVLKRFLDLCTQHHFKAVDRRKEKKRQAEDAEESDEEEVRFNSLNTSTSSLSKLKSLRTSANLAVSKFERTGTSPRPPDRTTSPPSPTSGRRRPRIAKLDSADSVEITQHKLAQLENVDDHDERDDFGDQEGDSDVEEEAPDDGLVELVPILVILLGYLAYLFSETIRFTGIVTIMVYGMVINHYEHYCMTDKHIGQLKYILGVAGHTSDSVVFLIVGQQFWVAVSQAPLGWNAGFILIAYLITNAGRTIGVIGLGWIDNIIRGQEHKKKIPMKDLALLSFGGLRGAIAFALVYTLVDEKYACVEVDDHARRMIRSTGGDATYNAVKIMPHKDVLLTTTLMLVILTVFIQGSLAGTMVQLLRTDREHAETTFDLTNNTLMEHLRKGFVAVATPQHKWRTGWLINQLLLWVEGQLKNKNYHFLTRFHYHAKSKVKERQATAFQILKAHYFTAHDHAQEMVTLAHRKNMSAEKIEQVKANMRQYIQSHLLMAMREQVQNHSTFHQNIAKAMIDAHDEAALELEDFSDSEAKFKAFHRVIRKNVRRAEHFHTDKGAEGRPSNHRRALNGSTAEVTGFKVGAGGIELQEGQGVIKDNFRHSYRQSIKSRRLTSHVAEPPKAWRKSSWTNKQIRRKMSMQINTARRSMSIGGAHSPAALVLGVAAREAAPMDTISASEIMLEQEEKSEIPEILAELREEIEPPPTPGSPSQRRRMRRASVSSTGSGSSISRTFDFTQNPPGSPRGRRRTLSFNEDRGDIVSRSTPRGRHRSSSYGEARLSAKSGQQAPKVAETLV